MTPTTAIVQTDSPRPVPRLDVDGPRAGYREAVASEWAKLRSIRSNLVVAGLLGAVLPLFAAVVALTGSLQPDDTVLGASLLGGAVIAQILAASLGATLVTSEVRTGTLRVTLAACPRRLVVLAAKATVVSGVVAVTTLVGSVAAHGVGLALLDTGTHATGEPFPAILGVVLALASIGALGVGLGTLVRHSAGAVVAVVGAVLLPSMLAPLLGDAQRWLGGASLDGVLQKMTQSSDATHETVGSLGAWPSLAVVAAYTAAVLVGAAWVLRRRDT